MQNEPLLQKGRHIGARLETEDTAVPECWQGDQGTTKAEIDRSGFLPLLQDQKHLQDQEQGLLQDPEAPVRAEPPVLAGDPV